MSVELYTETFYGCSDGKSVCYYSKYEDKDWIMFFDTDNDDGISTQSLNLVDGTYTYYVKCIDEGGNVVANSTSFGVQIDTQAPSVARVYEEDSMLKIVTVSKSDCSYSLENCDFLFEEGIAMPYANSTTHVADLDKSKTYYVKCRDEWNNEDSDCSITVGA